MSSESGTKPVMDYIKASLPILTNEDLAAAANAVLKEVEKRKKNGKE